MRNFSCYLVIAGMGLSLLFSAGWSLAEDEQSSQGSVEIIVQGKKYRSIREYRREQIKSAFEGILSSRDFREFTENDLTAIIKEIYDEVEGGPLEKEPESADQDTLQKGSKELDVSKKLSHYLEEHEDIDAMLVDFQDIENIVVEDQDSSRGISGN